MAEFRLLLGVHRRRGRRRWTRRLRLLAFIIRWFLVISHASALPSGPRRRRQSSRCEAPPLPSGPRPASVAAPVVELVAIPAGSALLSCRQPFLLPPCR